MTGTFSSPILERQLQFYAEQAGSWQAEHRAAMECLDLEAVVALGLTIFEQIRRLEQRAGEAARLAPGGSDPDAARSLSALYRLWYSPCESVLKEIKRLRNDGYRVERSNDFIQACRHARVPALYADQMIAAARPA